MTREDGARQVRSLAMSFVYAFRGVGYCIRTGRNMRIHLVVTVYVLAFAPFYRFETAEFLLLLVAIGLVLFAETVNTAIEVLVDMEKPCYNISARIVKDVAAGAVLICAVFAAAVGVILFGKPDVLAHIGRTLWENWPLGVLFLFSLPAAAVFIFRRPVPSGPRPVRMKSRRADKLK